MTIDLALKLIKPLDTNTKILKYTGDGYIRATPKYSSQVNLPFATVLDSAGPAVESLVKALMAKKTWSKHMSAWNSLTSFEKCSNIFLTWPLTMTNWGNYILWAITVKGLKPDTVRSYISSIKLAHTLKGLACLDPLKEEIFKMMLTGADNLRMSMGSLASSNTRRACTLPILKLLGHRIASLDWPDGVKQTTWAALTTGFFSSARLGELLPEGEMTYDPSSTLLWKDVLFRNNDSILIHIKLPKTSKPQGDFLDLFPFRESGCCPVASLQRLKTLQTREGCFRPGRPVFTFPSGRLLTPSKLNSILRDLLADICSPKTSIISCHIMRAAEPTALAPLSHNTVQDTLSWGRWTSNSFKQYVKPNTKVKKDIFGRIIQQMS